MASTVTGLSQVVKGLYELQCCARCVLRYVGFQDTTTYAKSYKEVVQYVSNKFESASPTTTAEDAICVTCLGLLQMHSETQLIKQMCDSVKTTEHEYHNFTMAVFSPLVLNFRHHSMWIYLQEKFSSVYPTAVTLENILPVKDVLKYVYGPRIEAELDSKFYRKSPFKIIVTMTHSEAMRELDFLSKTPKVLKCHPRKRQKVLNNQPTITTNQVINCIETLKTSADFIKVGNCPPKSVNSCCEIGKVECEHWSVFLAGRYNKYSRHLSQSPWLVGEQRMTESSVQELISEEIKKIFRPDEIKFSSAGREDVDVRMLGNGRPFILELINPRKENLSPEQMKILQSAVNNTSEDIHVRDLQMIEREECSKLKAAEESKTKSYNALVYVPGGITEEEIKPLNDMKDTTLMQKTPLRVVHRRVLATRPRTIHFMTTEFMDKNHFRLRLCTEAGTYIKEFVHGDFGRTKPNLTVILNKETDILELDVESVDVDWPPRIDT